MALYFNGTKIGQVGVKFEGTNGTDTSDATLNSNDQLLRGVSAYAKGVKYTGTISTVSAVTPTVNLDTTTGVVTASITQPKGYVATQATKTATLTLTTTEGKTITPSSTSQVAVAADTYVKGQISIAAVPTETKTIVANGTYTPSTGKYFSEVTVSIAGNSPTYQTKIITPTTTRQTINPDSGYDALSSVTVNAIQTETKTVTTNGTYTPTSGKYFSSVSVNVPSGGIDTSDATATANDIVKGKTAYVNGSKIEGNVYEITGGMTTACKKINNVTNGVFVLQTYSFSDENNFLFRPKTTATVNIPDSTFGNATAADVAKGKTFTSAAGLKVTGTATASTSSPSLQSKTVTPTTSKQTITADTGYDGLDTVTINAISTQTKSTTPTTSQQTISADSGKYLTSVTISAIQTETKNITDNGTYTPTSGKYFSSVIVNVPYQTYRTGSGAPSNSLGSNGDLYFDMG